MVSPEKQTSLQNHLSFPLNKFLLMLYRKKMPRTMEDTRLDILNKFRMKTFVIEYLKLYQNNLMGTDMASDE